MLIGDAPDCTLACLERDSSHGANQLQSQPEGLLYQSIHAHGELTGTLVPVGDGCGNGNKKIAPIWVLVG
jgi:hypothetical protein